MFRDLVVSKNTFVVPNYYLLQFSGFLNFLLVFVSIERVCLSNIIAITYRENYNTENKNNHLKSLQSTFV